VKRILIVTLVLALVATAMVGAQTSDGPVTIKTSPGFSFTDDASSLPGVSQSDLDGWETQVNGTIQDQLNTAVDAANEELAALPNVGALAVPFANAGLYAASNVATQRSYPDYRSFYFALGTNGAAFTPDAATLEKLGGEDPLAAFSASADEGVAGLGSQIWSLSGGISLDFIADGLYLGGKFGGLELPGMALADGITADVESGNFGGLLSYRLIGNLFPRGPIRFRGISINTGAIVHRSLYRLNLDFESFTGGEGGFEQDITEDLFPSDLVTALQNGDSGDYPDDGVLGKASAGLPQSATMTIENSGLVVPIELATALRILYFFDFSLGAGIDLNFGDPTSATFSADDSTAEVTGYLNDSQYLQVNNGAIGLGESAEGAAEFVNPRITAGAAINIGPIKLDFPVALYIPMEEESEQLGVSAGFNVGLLW